MSEHSSPQKEKSDLHLQTEMADATEVDGKSNSFDNDEGGSIAQITIPSLLLGEYICY
jgi:hypothetical protein